MIVYHPDLSSQFENFAIPIPLSDDRSEKIYKNNLSKDIHLLNHVEPLSLEDLLRVHSQKFIDDLFSDNLYDRLHECFELSHYVPQGNKFNASGLRDHILFQVAATYHSMQFCLNEPYVFHLGGGMHHAHTDHGSGFCLLNDVVIGIRKMQSLNKIKNAVIIDVDAHRGDGTAEVVANDSTIDCLSIHMAEGWPLDSQEGKNAVLGNWEIPISENEEDIYNTKLDQALSSIENLYDLAVVVMGADPYEYDELPSSQLLKLTKQQMLERDLIVHNYLMNRKIPTLYVMGGGYGTRAWEIYHQFLQNI